MLTLLNESAELALDLLEKNGQLLPFCKARTFDQASVVITPDENESSSESDGHLRRCEDSVKSELRRRIASRMITEFAFCVDQEIKLQNEPEYRRFLKIEFQNGTEESAVYLFPLTVEKGKAQLGANYLLADIPERLL